LGPSARAAEGAVAGAGHPIIDPHRAGLDLRSDRGQGLRNLLDGVGITLGACIVTMLIKTALIIELRFENR
jgi:hypothetical protein